MSRHEDDLDGLEDLSDRQRWAVSRYQARAGRYQRDRIELTNRDRWARFQAAEQDNEDRKFGKA